jgi:hypothetical protein
MALFGLHHWFFLQGSIADRSAWGNFVTTNSICQGQQVNVLWSLLLDKTKIISAHTSFKWANLAQSNAGVTVIIIQIAGKNNKTEKRIYDDGSVRIVGTISPYLTAQEVPLIGNAQYTLSDLPEMTNGCAAKDGGSLLMDEKSEIPSEDKIALSVVKELWGADEVITGTPRYCLWIEESEVEKVTQSNFLKQRIDAVRKMRLKSEKAATRIWAEKPYRFVEIRRPQSNHIFVMPVHVSEKRPYLSPILLEARNAVVTNAAFVMYDPAVWTLGLLVSRIHYVWVKAVCGQLETRIRYSNTLGWNTFPVPFLTEQNKTDLTRCAENILLAREAHFPATIADLYDPDNMPDNLRQAHDRNDELLERIYIGRRFKNDTERLEKLFELYTRMTTASTLAPKPVLKSKPRKVNQDLASKT